MDDEMFKKYLEIHVDLASSCTVWSINMQTVVEATEVDKITQEEYVAQQE